MAKKEFPEGFVESLTWLCDSYDAESGEYPESCYEGKALLQYYYMEREAISEIKQKEEKG